MIRRKSDIFISSLIAIIDFAAVLGAFMFSYWIRFQSGWVIVTKGYPEFDPYLQGSFFVALVWLFIFQQLRLYRMRRNTLFVDDLAKLFRGVLVGLLVVISVAFFYREFSFSRLVFLLLGIFAFIFLAFARYVSRLIERQLYRNNIGVLNAGVFGDGTLGNTVFNRLKDNKRSGYLFKSMISKNQISQIQSIIRENDLDVIFVAVEHHDHSSLVELVRACEGLNVEFLLLPDLLEIMTSQVQVFQIEGLQFLRLKQVAITGWQGVMKRAFDIVFSLFCLIIFFPIFILMAIVIKMDSKGSILYRQTRIGLDRKEFYVYKFRSMLENAESDTGPVWAKKDDPRVTSVGRFLRRSSLDELPQLWNVLKGEMSIVGPRPERPFFVEQFKDQIPKYSERHRVKCGITGWAQVNGHRQNAPIEERTKYDVFYVENWSLLFDLKIIAMTIMAVMIGDDAY